MTKLRPIPIVRSAVVAAVAAICLAMPAAWAQKSAEKAAEDRLAFRKSVETIRGQIDATLKALNAIPEGKDSGARKSALKKYGDQVKEMEKQVEKTRDYAKSMKERGQAYFKEWEKSTKSVKNEELKASATAQRTALQAQYDKIQAGIDKAKDVSSRFWKNVQDLQAFFEGDLSDNAMTTSAGLVKSVNEDGKAIQGSIDEVIAAVDKVGTQEAKTPEEPAKPEAAAPETEKKPAEEPKPPTP